MASSFFIFYSDSSQLLLPSCFGSILEKFRFHHSTIVIMHFHLGLKWNVCLKVVDNQFAFFGPEWFRLTRELKLLPGHFLFFTANEGVEEPFFDIVVSRLSGGSFDDYHYKSTPVTFAERQNAHFDFTIKATNPFV